MVVKLILFDIDGTLIHTRGAGVKAFEKTFAAEFKIPNAIENVTFAGRTDPSIVKEIFERHHLEPTPERMSRFFEAYVFWLDYLLCKTEGGICAGIWNFVHEVNKVKCPPILGLLTGNIRLGAEIKLRHYQLWDYFQTGAFGDDNPDRNALAQIARERGSRLAGRELQGEEVLVIGDTPLDIACAESIGARMLAVATGPYPVDQLKCNSKGRAVANLSCLTVEEACK